MNKSKCKVECPGLNRENRCIGKCRAGISISRNRAEVDRVSSDTMQLTDQMSEQQSRIL